MVLIGQPELRSLLRLKSLEAVAQRVTVRFHLSPLDEERTALYLQHQLRAAGGERQVFTEAAARLLHAQTRGLPRPLNTLDHLASGTSPSAEARWSRKTTCGGHWPTP